jgi:hypothetical protein
MERIDYEKHVIQDLINFRKLEELNLNPWYQRRSVWTKSQQAYLINTLVERKPVPTVYVRHSIDLEREKSIKEVVDGQQRIRSIFDFKDGKFTVRHPKYKKRVKFNELSPIDREHFLMTPISVGYLIGATEPDVIDIFGRINSVSKTLNAQEKRNAKFSGEFKQFALSNATKLLPFWRSTKIFSDNDISRMSEVQFISDLVMNVTDGLNTTSQARLDKYYATNDETFELWEKAESDLDKTFTKLNDLPAETISKSSFRREPLLFSLCIVMMDYNKISSKNLASIIDEIDNIIDLDVEIGARKKSEAAFIEAIASSTQTISSRKVRDKFIRNYFESL